MYKLLSTVAGVAMVVSSQAIAEPVKGTAELGFLSTSGNSESESLNAKLTLEKATENWAHKAELSAISSSNDGDSTAEQYNLSLKSDRNLSEDSYLYGLFNYDDNRFSGYDYQSSLGLGYGHKVINNDEQVLALEVGVGYRINALSPADDEKEATYRLGQTYDWKFSPSASLNQYANVESGSDNTTYKYGLSVTSAMTETLSLKIGYDATRNSDAPAGSKKTDSQTYANVTYSF